MSAQLDYIVVLLGSIVVVATVATLALFVALSSKRELSIRRKADEELRKSHEQIRNLSAHLQSAIEKERTEVAREIHDELGQALTALKFDLYWLSKRLPNTQNGLTEKTASMISLIDETMRAVKRIATRLRPAILDDLGLIAALEWEVEEFQKHMGIECKLTAHPENLDFDGDRSTAIYRIAQEALTNVARHSQASRVELVLMDYSDLLSLEIDDNGIGITPEQISSSSSFGLLGIRERVLEFGGEFTVAGRKNEGTKLAVTIPLDKRD